jgi:hypothetical protein
MRTSENGGKDHIHEKVANDEDTRLSQEEAKEQLLYKMRNQMGVITFDVVENDEGRGDGVVVAKLNGRQADHYIYHEL